MLQQEHYGDVQKDRSAKVTKIIMGILKRKNREGSHIK